MTGTLDFDYEGAFSSIGYSPRRRGNTLEMAAIHRNGDNPSNFVVFLDSGKCYDRKTGEGGLAKNILKKKGYKITSGESQIKTSKQPVVKFKARKYPVSALNRLTFDPAYFLGRGISEATQRDFRSGFALKGKFFNRVVFPIFNNNATNIIGFNARDTSGKSSAKWIIDGNKKEFCYPFWLNGKILEEKKEIILVESIGDCLALWEAGIKNVLVLFGIYMIPAVFKKIIEINPSKICISLNNSKYGKSGSQKICAQLRNFFNPDVVKVYLPVEEDFGDMNTKGILEWAKKI